MERYNNSTIKYLHDFEYELLLIVVEAALGRVIKKNEASRIAVNAIRKDSLDSISKFI